MPRKPEGSAPGPRKGRRGASKTAARGSVPSWELSRFLALEHNAPHSILGIHPSQDGTVVRVFRPDAEEVQVIPDGGKARKLAPVHPAGLFEGLFADRQEAFPYRVKVRYPQETEFTFRDPYSFWPTLGDLDLHLFNEGNHQRLWEKLGSHYLEHQGVPGFSFAVWAPSAKSVSLVGDFNGWDGRLHTMRMMGASGVWEIFIPELGEDSNYKFEIRTYQGGYLLKADPFAFRTEEPPKTASRVHVSRYEFDDQAWLDARNATRHLQGPISIYEVHLGSWRRVPEEGNRPLSYSELAHAFADYVQDLGFTHVEFMPVMEHPFGGSWGYQVSSYYAPTARHGDPDEFKFLVDELHNRGIGVILDWVPAHFPKDDFALGRFDGTALYEHQDPRQGEHPDWGTFVFNFGRKEVRNFLIANALYWLTQYHIDGLRLDAVASMLYLDYSRKEGEWVPNCYGGRENLEAIEFLKHLNAWTHTQEPGVLMIAEESTAWPAVSRPTYAGGLGFGYKWNMGWMHDTLNYFTKDPVYRRYHHNDLTFGFLYAWSENFVLPLSHDEVVHGKGALLSKMPGDRWQKFANLRSLYAYMWAYPGKKLLFMGCEIGQWDEWKHDASVDWHLLEGREHWGVQQLIRDLNRLYRSEPALSEADADPSGFSWIDCRNADDNVVSFLRTAPRSRRQVVCICNFSPVPRYAYRVGLPRPGWYREILNTDASLYGGVNIGNGGGVNAQVQPWNDQPCSGVFDLPPLSVLWFEAPGW